MEIDIDWSEKRASFPGISRNCIPKSECLEPLFVQCSKEKWPTNASINYSMKDGRFARLIIIANFDYGFWLQYEAKLDGCYQIAFSLGDKDALSEYVSIVEDSVTLKGLYITPAKAWLAVKYFISSNGLRKNEIEWISEKDIPAGKYWSVS